LNIARELQVLDDRAVEALARDQQRNARRVRRQQHAGHAAFEVVDLDAVDLAVRHGGEGVGGLHRRLHVGQVHLGGHARHVVGLVDAVDLLAQVAQAEFLVARVLGARTPAARATAAGSCRSRP
jgi:hypothetical protein